MLWRLSFCISLLLGLLFVYLDKQNELTQLKIMVPKVEKQIFLLKEENRRLKYEIEKFESPSHLMQLVRLPEFSHLKHPLVKNVLKVEEGMAVNSSALQLQH